jgi:hypothetical protein
MKFVRWAAALVLALMSLMNLGSATGDGTGAGLIVAGILLGVPGLIAVYGLFRDRTWAPPLAAGVGAINLLLAVIGIAAGWPGAAIGTTVSAVGLALVLPFVLRRRTAVAAH